jgi:hypothetical protein
MASIMLIQVLLQYPTRTTFLDEADSYGKYQGYDGGNTIYPIPEQR